VKIKVSAFDGDEANLHVPQGPKCVAEMMTQMNIEQKIMTCQTSSNIVDLVQGVIIGLYILSQDYTFIDKGIFFDLCMSMTSTEKWEDDYLRKFELKEFYNRIYKSKYKKLVKKKKGEYILVAEKIPGKVVFSMLLPRYYTSKLSTKYEDGKLKEGAVIENGVFVDGTLTKKTMNRVVQELYIIFGRQSAINYINGANFLCNTWNLMHGFTFGLQDCLNTQKDKVAEALKDADKEVAYINSMPKSDAEKEILIKEALGAATQVAQKISRDGMVGGEKNAMAISTLSKAKGSYVNLCYISCFLGLQTVMGDRYAPQLCEGTRTLPCFKRNDMTSKSRGFVKSNFYGGLDPAGLFFHGWSARKGLIDTAVTTRTSGYSHRQFGKKMENARVDQYGTVRDCDGSIIDFCYGEYGFDASEVFWNKGIPFFIDFEKVASIINMEWKDSHPKEQEPGLLEFKEKHLKVLNSHLIIYGQTINNPPTIAVKDRIAQVVKEQMKGVKVYANKECLNKFFDTIRSSFYRSRATPGNMVGFKATCSIGEAGTQAVLDAFHQSGTSSKTTTIGLPRLEELTNLTKFENLKVAGGSFIYKDKVLQNGTKSEKLKRVNELRSEFEHKTLQDFCEITIEKLTKDEPTNEWEVLMNIHKVHEMPEWFDTWVEVNGFDQPDLEEGFVVKCAVKKEMLYKYGKTLHDLVDCLDIDKYFVVPSPPSLSTLYIYPNYDNVSLPKTIDSAAENWRYYYTRDVCASDISDTTVCGIPGIHEIFYHESEEGNNIDYQGNNFVELMNNPKIKFSSLETDVIWDVYNNLGINAAFIFLYEELSKCTAKSLNPSHFMLLSRTMTNEGFLTNVTRNGISDKVGILTKASFETPVDNCLSAAVWGKNDGVDSLASSYFLGTVGKYGTRNPNFEVANDKGKIVSF